MHEQSRSTFLVAHDFSSAAVAATELAFAEISRDDANAPHRLVLAHVYDEANASISGVARLAPPLPVENEQHRVEERHALQDIADDLRGRWLEETGGEVPLDVEVSLLTGFAADAIVKEAARVGAERIFVGTHARQGLTRVLLGSVAELIVRRAHVPVVVAHAARPEHEADAAAQPALRWANRLISLF